MPWAPRDEEEVGDPRLDPFRQRAGILVDDAGEEVGHVFLQVLQTWTRAGGHLWWSRWNPPEEVVHGHTLLRGGSPDRWVISGARLDASIADWRDEAFGHAGRRYRVVWQGDEESDRVRRGVFGLD